MPRDAVYILRRADNAAALTKGLLWKSLNRNAHVGPHTAFYGKVRFLTAGETTVGTHLWVDGKVAMVSIMVYNTGKLVIGDYTSITWGATIEARRDVRIGNHVLFGPGASLIDDDRHLVEPDTQMYKGPTILEDNVWIGRYAVITPGVTVGKNSVIGANSVVSRDIPPDVFAAGAPAKPIKKLDIPEGWAREAFPSEAPGHPLTHYHYQAQR